MTKRDFLQAFTGAATAAVATAGVARTARAASLPKKLTLDVATDARTWAFQRTDATPTTFARGDWFITEGPIYEAGSITPGNTPYPATNARVIGKWVCRGVIYHDAAAVFAGQAPHAFTTQYFFLDDGSLLVTEGLEGGAAFRRAVIGGTIEGSGVAGEVLETPIGINQTGLFNLRFEFDLK